MTMGINCGRGFLKISLFHHLYRNIPKVVHHASLFIYLRRVNELFQLYVEHYKLELGGWSPRIIHWQKSLKKQTFFPDFLKIIIFLSNGWIIGPFLPKIFSFWENLGKTPSSFSKFSYDFCQCGKGSPRIVIVGFTQCTGYCPNHYRCYSH